MSLLDIKKLYRRLLYRLPLDWPREKDGIAVIGPPYARIRHPQYVGFVLIMLGFLVQWPTILTLAMFPILLIMYWRLSLSEEREAIAEFGERYRQYAACVPRFFPKLRTSISSERGA